MCFKVTRLTNSKQVIEMLCQLSSTKADSVLLKALRLQLTADAHSPITLDLLEAAKRRGVKSLVDAAGEIENKRTRKILWGTTESASRVEM